MPMNNDTQRLAFLMALSASNVNLSDADSESLQAWLLQQRANPASADTWSNNERAEIDRMQSTYGEELMDLEHLAALRLIDESDFNLPDSDSRMLEFLLTKAGQQSTVRFAPEEREEIEKLEEKYADN